MGAMADGTGHAGGADGRATDPPGWRGRRHAAGLVHAKHAGCGEWHVRRPWAATDGEHVGSSYVDG